MARSVTAVGCAPHNGAKRARDPDLSYGPDPEIAQLKSYPLQRYSKQKDIEHDSSQAGNGSSQHVRNNSRAQQCVEHADKSQGLSQALDCKASRETVNVKAIAVELCAGSAKLSFQLHAIGFLTIAVDWVRNKHTARMPVI